MASAKEDFFMTQLTVEQFGLLANAVVRFDRDTESYSFEHQSSSYVNPEWSFDHFVDSPKRITTGMIELQLTNEYTLCGGPIVTVTPISFGNAMVVANVSIHGRILGVHLCDLSGQKCDSDFSIMAIMPIGH